MINWGKEGGRDLTKFLKANKTKREKKYGFFFFLGHSKNIWGDQHILKNFLSLLFPFLSCQ